MSPSGWGAATGSKGVGAEAPPTKDLALTKADSEWGDWKRRSEREAEAPHNRPRRHEVFCGRGFSPDTLLGPHA
ncbi:DUF6053 domain-containing protein [Lysobacter sp. CA199]|uniref:DUF6053 domain-containing protein n=1 Tax=Lysobacter sp. CA199 TaxID=3455608 RepID=UPI003F8D5ED0